MPVEFDITAFRYRGPSREACYELFSELGFRSLVMEYAPTADTIEKDYRVVDTLEGVRQLAAELKAAGRFALRVLPDSPAAVQAGIVGLAFSIAPRQAWYVPIGHVEANSCIRSPSRPERAGLPGPVRPADPGTCSTLPDADASAPPRSAPLPSASSAPLSSSTH